MTPLPLDNERWATFKSWFGNPAKLPRRIARWHTAIGTEGEEAAWYEVFEQILHQMTITDAAYAAFPHIVLELNRAPANRRLDYLINLATIESNRQTDYAAIPDGLQDAYFSALAEARKACVNALFDPLPESDFKYLLSSLASLLGFGTLGMILFNLECISDECPKCGEWVYPTEIQEWYTQVEARK